MTLLNFWSTQIEQMKIYLFFKSSAFSSLQCVYTCVLFITWKFKLPRGDLFWKVIIALFRNRELFSHQCQSVYVCMSQFTHCKVRQAVCGSVWMYCICMCACVCVCVCVCRSMLIHAVPVMSRQRAHRTPGLDSSSVAGLDWWAHSKCFFVQISGSLVAFAHFNTKQNISVRFLGLAGSPWISLVIPA